MTTPASPQPGNRGWGVLCATVGCGHALGQHYFPSAGGTDCKKCDCAMFTEPAAAADQPSAANGQMDTGNGHDQPRSLSQERRLAVQGADQPGAGGEADEVPGPRFAWVKPPPYSHRVQVSPAPSAGQDTGCADLHDTVIDGVPLVPADHWGQDTERLRDELARWLFEQIRYDHAHPLAWEELWTGALDGWLAKADALLNGPLRQLIAERDEARGQVQRVRETAAEFADRIRRALDEP